MDGKALAERVRAEVAEEVRELGGAKHAIGELLTCPFCLDQWIATGLTASYLVAPRFTRVASSTLTAVALSDSIQYAHTALQKRA